MIPLLLIQVEERLQFHTDQAESAYVTEYTTRCSRNCHHARTLSNGVFACSERRWGTSEEAALTCTNAKSPACPGFTPTHTEDELRTKFRAMPKAELA